MLKAVSSGSSGGGSGTVTSVSVTTANGVSGSVATPTTTPAITLTLGAITPSSVTIGAGSAITSSGPGGALTALGFTAPGTGVATALAINVGSAGAFVTFNGAGGTPSSLVGTNITGTAAGLTAGTVTTNANLTGVITSVGNATSIASQTGTGTKFVVDTAPTIVGMTNSGNGAASSPSTLFSGTLFTGGSGTTTFPQVLFQPTGTTARTDYATTGTMIGANLVSGSTADFLNFGIGGAASVFKVASSGALTASGQITTAASLQVGATNSIFFNGRSAIGSAANGSLTFSTLAGTSSFILSAPTATATPTIQLGALDAGAPVAQTLRVQSVVAGTAAANGANWTLIGSLPTGTGTSGDIILQTGVKTGSGTTQGTATTALTIKGETQAITIASGKSLVLGNSATTGLAAGVLAALTNASVVITDASGQAYRIPCII